MRSFLLMERISYSIAVDRRCRWDGWGWDLALLEGDGLVFLVVAVFAHEGLE